MASALGGDDLVEEQKARLAGQITARSHVDPFLVRISPR